MITLNNSNIDFDIDNQGLESKYSITLSEITSNLIFKTNGSERMTIMNNGNIGIGKSGANYKLDINGTINATTFYVSGGDISIKTVDTSNYVRDTSNILLGRIVDTSNYTKDTSNILVGRIVDTSNYVRDTSNILVGRVVDTSNYVRDTSNILVGRIVDTSNYVRDTSNILVGRIVDTSNYVRDTSNIVIGRIVDTSNYVRDTSNILVGRVVDTSNYVRDTSNILVGRVVDTSNYVTNLSALVYNIIFSDLPEIIGAEGAISTTIGVSDRMIIFPYSGTETFKEYSFTLIENLICDILVVGGGGGGGGGYGGGGGGGGGSILFGTNLKFREGYPISIKVGKGGIRGGDLGNGGNGGSSTITISAIEDNVYAGGEYYANGGGGGGGGYYSSPNNGNDGGSGGGGSQTSFEDPETSGGVSNKDNFLFFLSFGNNGGRGIITSDDPYAEDYKIFAQPGGGGGAGSVGGNSTIITDGVNFQQIGGTGGTGKEFISYFGTSVGDNGYFAGGGGGSTSHYYYTTDIYGYGNGGIGLFGGGGDGSLYIYDNKTITAENGLDNTGGGGGGGLYNLPPGKGGSGIVIIRYRIDKSIPNQINKSKTIFILNNYVESIKNMLPDSISNTSNYVRDTSNILVCRIVDTSNYVRDTSNILVGRIVDTSNYVRDTSNILVGCIVDTSNYVRDTSNILVGRIVDTSNYVRDTSNILVGRIVETSNYVKDSSNILVGRIRDTSNYVKDSSNILIGMIKSVQSSGPSNPWTTTNNMIYYNTSNVGIGTNNPVSKLHLYEEVNFESKLTIQNYFNGPNNFNNSLVSSPSASESGSITGSSTDKFMIFKDPTLTYILTVPDGGISCDILMIGGGGSGYGGGGGAGACIIAINQNLYQNTYKVYVGYGGNDTNFNGDDSKINTVNDTVIFCAKGGGRGGADDSTDSTGIGGNGGCGGGAQGVYTYTNNVRAGGTSVSTNIVNGVQTGPTLTETYVVLGNKGGSKTVNDANFILMGGGGIGAQGPDYTDTNNILIQGTGDGGAGLNTVTINSIPYNFKSYFANGLAFGHNDNGYIGGGGGGDIRTYGSSPNCVGGIGGGGNGYSSGDAYAGASNTGGGGGAGALNRISGGIARRNGGSGIVIIRYRPIISSLVSSSYIELIRGTSSDTSDDYMIGNYNHQLKIKSSRSNLITDRLVINSIGNVGIGKNNPSYTLEVVPILPYNTNIPASVSTFSLSGTTGISYFTTQQNTIPICTKFNGGIWVEGCYATTSDIRTKEDIQNINDNCALLKILAIEPKTYKYIDKVEKGENKVYGFIAQQIKKVIPEAISLENSYVPNIMSNADYYNNIITLPYLPTKVTINVKDKIKCFDINNNCIEVEVSKIINELEFEIKDLDKEYKNNRIFVYGTYVTDFHTLSKEHIFSLNVGATQELYRLIKKQDDIIKSHKRINALKQTNVDLYQKYEMLLKELTLIKKKAN